MTPLRADLCSPLPTSAPLPPPSTWRSALMSSHRLAASTCCASAASRCVCGGEWAAAPAAAAAAAAPLLPPPCCCCRLCTSLGRPQSLGPHSLPVTTVACPPALIGPAACLPACPLPADGEQQEPADRCVHGYAQRQHGGVRRPRGRCCGGGAGTGRRRRRGGARPHWQPRQRRQWRGGGWGVGGCSRGPPPWLGPHLCCACSCTARPRTFTPHPPHRTSHTCLPASWVVPAAAAAARRGAQPQPAHPGGRRLGHCGRPHRVLPDGPAGAAGRAAAAGLAGDGRVSRRAVWLWLLQPTLAHACLGGP